MKSISKLKDEARRHEQREEWEKAIQAYLQVLRTADEGETEVELPLYNRVGDLFVRLGKPQEAVRHYEQAADRYAEAGLYNNAIALCNKALRYSPDRLELIRKLGQFSASQGFITDARRYFLDYAERQFKAGKVTEALTALEDFANVSDDADVREMLGRQLHAHGRINDAVDELRRARAMRLREGNTEKAEALRAEILAIDPQAEIDGGAAPDVPRTTGRTELPGLAEIEPVGLVETEVFEVETTAAADTGTIEGLETSVSPSEETELAPLDLDRFEPAGEVELADIGPVQGGGIEGLETTTLDFDSVAGEAPPAEDLGIEREEISFGDSERAGEIFELPGLDEPMADTDLPLIQDGESFDLPLLGDDAPVARGEEATPLPPPSIDDATPDQPLSFDPDDLDLGGDLPLDLTSFGTSFGTGSAFEPLSMDEDLPATPELTGEEPSFDLPSFEPEGLELPAWEPEAEPPPEPTFATGQEPEEVEPPAIPEPPPAVQEPAPAIPEPPPAVEEPAPAVQEAAPADLVTPEPVEEPQYEQPEAAAPEITGIPAIELPTWEFDTGGITTDAPTDQERAEAGFDEPAFEVESEWVEPTWVEPEQDESEESASQLPTFTYEDEGDSADIADIDALVDESLAADDEDPLGLAAYLPGYTRPERTVEVPPPTPPRETDWLDEIGADEAAAPTEAPPVEHRLDEQAPAPETDVGSLDMSIDDYGVVADSTATAPASVEDTVEEIANSQAAAREMAEAPPVVKAPPPAQTPPLAAQPPAAAEPPIVEPPAAAEPPIVERPAAREAAPGPVAPRPPAKAADAGGFIDLGAFISADDEEETTRFRVMETAPTGDEDRDFAELLSQFKSKVQEHLPPEDAAAHYDLGLAFKEMGLVDEAIGEFQVALRAGHMRLKVCEELGQCFLQKEQYNIAQKVLSRALDMKYEDELELLGVYYHLGRAYEALGRRDDARDAYERVLGMDINFQDVTDRLARL